MDGQMDKRAEIIIMGWQKDSLLSSLTFSPQKLTFEKEPLYFLLPKPTFAIIEHQNSRRHSFTSSHHISQLQSCPALTMEITMS
ncbi:hypothetical protein JZ751_026854 [Albula glossodonta]|uniref:Uncharacterized protein n=1 Tax=Albula glossodonta TaxID=121402 RepID=A0A8T2PLF2_9TELE|nr:hypothetical protein JZ751_026854 [Albula glossodonta]